MNPHRYDSNLAESIYRTVKFIIDINHFDDEIPKDLEMLADFWFDEKDDAMKAAKKISKYIKKTVEIEAYGKWGHHGIELIETIKVNG